MKAEQPKLLRVSKAAHEPGLHPFTVRKWIKQGKMQAVRIGQEAQVPRSEIERLAGKIEDEWVIILYGPVLRSEPRSRKVDKCGTVALSAPFLRRYHVQLCR